MKIVNLSRKEPLKDYEDLSQLENLYQSDAYSYDVLKEEYFVVQLLIAEADGPAKITFLTEGESEVLNGRMTCFNTEGVDKYGQAFQKDFKLKADAINPVYLGFDFAGLESGEYCATVEVKAGETKAVALTFVVNENAVKNHGYNDLWRLSRLNWLNSRLAEEGELPAPYTPICWKGKTAKILGRELTFDDQGQLIAVKSFFDESACLADGPQVEYLAAPITFTALGEQFESKKLQIKKGAEHSVITAELTGDAIDLKTEAVLHCEGALEYTIKVTAKKDTETEFVFTQTMDKQACRYNFGLGKKGGFFEPIDFKWSAEVHQDCLFIGDMRAGIRTKFKAENYQKPLINVYYRTRPLIVPATTWDNDGKGRITAAKTEQGAVLCARTGNMQLKQGEVRVFRYALHLTPFRPIDYKKHFAVRYYHNYNMKDFDKEIETAKAKGLTHINVHHGNELYPFINYPFYNAEDLKKFIEKAHKKNLSVKVYYTLREHGSHMAEVFPYKSMGDEIIMRKKGEGLEWLKSIAWLTENIGEDVTPAWQVYYKRGKFKGDHDITFIVTPDSRLENYYIEGLKWLIDELGIDGIYIDDTALDAVTLRRARRLLDASGGLIDMHMWNHEEARAGNAVCANLYTDIFPFIDSLWVGEGFPIDSLAPEYILTEVSGLLYGNTSQMLEGVDLYAGMLYAMNSRYGWHVRDADAVYRLWDDFGIEEAKMLGYWHSQNPISTDAEDVLVTTYLKKDSALVCVYNFSQEKKKFRYNLDAQKLGFETDESLMFVSEIKGKQRAKQYPFSAEQTLKGKKGIIFEICRKF